MLVWLFILFCCFSFLFWIDASVFPVSSLCNLQSFFSLLLRFCLPSPHLQSGGGCSELGQLSRSAPLLHWQAEQTHCVGSTRQQARTFQPLLWLFPSCKNPPALYFVDSVQHPSTVALEFCVQLCQLDHLNTFTDYFTDLPFFTTDTHISISY